VFTIHTLIPELAKRHGKIYILSDKLRFYSNYPFYIKPLDDKYAIWCYYPYEIVPTYEVLKHCVEINGKFIKCRFSIVQDRLCADWISPKEEIFSTIEQLKCYLGFAVKELLTQEYDRTNAKEETV